MIDDVIEKYRNLVVVNDEDTVNAMQGVMVKLPESFLLHCYSYSSKSGRAIVFRDERFPGFVMEYIPDQANDTSVTTLYADHSIFQSAQSHVDAREEIIAAIDSHFMAVPNTVTVMDGGRNKECFLVELGTAQLLDVLALITERAAPGVAV